MINLNMMEAMLSTAVQTAVLFVMMGVGVIARRIGVFDADSIKRLTDFLIRFITPCLIISSFQRPCDSSRIVSFGWAFAASVTATVIAIVLARLCMRTDDKRKRSVLEWACVFSNCGYMGIPLEQAIFGDEGVFYGISAIAVFNIFAWTYGVWMMGGAVGKTEIIKGIVNPANIAVAIALPLFFLPWRLPFIIAKPIEHIGSLNTPIAMIVMGYYLASAKFGAAFKCKYTYLMLLIRHLVVPLLLVAILAFCPFISTMARLSSVVPASAPIGVLLTVFAVWYDCDAEFSTALVAVSTIFSIFTIPVVIAIASVVF